MYKYTLGVDKMACSMCEAHVNDTIRQKFNVKKVNSSLTKKETVILSEDDIAEDELKSAIEATGYEMTSYRKEEYVKKSLFGRKK